MNLKPDVPRIFGILVVPVDCPLNQSVGHEDIMRISLGYPVKKTIPVVPGLAGAAVLAKSRDHKKIMVYFTYMGYVVS